jgi:transportin-3
VRTLLSFLSFFVDALLSFLAVLEDYVHLVQALIEAAPDHMFLSPAFPAAFQSSLTALTLPSVRIVLTALDTIRAVIGHDSLHYDPSDPHFSPAQHAVFPSYVAAIRAVVEASSVQLIQLLLDVLVGGGEDEPHNVLTILRLLSIQFPTVLAQTVPSGIELLGSKAVGPTEKAEFLNKFNAYISPPFPLLCPP